MNPVLTRFLGADDLDELGAARAEITEISRPDAEALADIVRSGSDRQAMANLLIYPEVIPEHVRVATVLGALRRELSDYLLVSAVVGISRVEFEHSVRSDVAERLLELAAGADEPLSMLAGRAFGSFADALDCQDAVERLGDFRPSERHNVLAGLLDQFGDDAISEALHVARDVHMMSPYDIDDIEERLAQAAAPNSLARLPLLAYIPNLKEWHEEV